MISSDLKLQHLCPKISLHCLTFSFFQVPARPGREAGLPAGSAGSEGASLLPALPLLPGEVLHLQGPHLPPAPRALWQGGGRGGLTAPGDTSSQEFRPNDSAEIELGFYMSLYLLLPLFSLSSPWPSFF